MCLGLKLNLPAGNNLINHSKSSRKPKLFAKLWFWGGGGVFLGVVFFQTTIVQYFTKKLRTPNNNLMREKTLIGGKALFPPPLICKREFHFLCIAYCCILFYTGERGTGESENSPPASSAALRAFDFCSQSRLLCKRISCASRAAEKRRSRWRGARHGPAPAAKAMVRVRAREPGVPRACPCFGDVCRGWWGRATACPPVQPSPIGMLLAKPRPDDGKAEPCLLLSNTKFHSSEISLCPLNQSLFLSFIWKRIKQPVRLRARITSSD